MHAAKRASSEAVRAVEAAEPQSKGMIWGGRIATGIAGLILIASSVGKLLGGAGIAGVKAVNEGFSQFGFAEKLILPIGILELACAILYLLPKTRVLGAILVTAYFGGAVATHVRADDPFIVPVGVAILAWAGVYLTDPRLRALVPFVSSR